MTRTAANTWQYVPASRFGEIASGWDALCKRGAGCLLTSAAFVETALQQLGAGNETVCLCHGPAGLLAATIVQRDRSLAWDVFRAAQMPLAPWLQEPLQDTAVLARELLGQLPGCAVALGISGLDSRFVQQPQGTVALALDWLSTGCVDLTAAPEDYFGTRDGRQMAGLMRRMRKATREVGEVRLHTETLAERVRPFVAQYAALEGRSWKGRQGTALQLGDAQSNFYTALLERMASHRHVRLYTLTIGAHVAAGQMALCEGDTLYLLKTTFSPDLQNLGPGVMMHYLITRHCYEAEPALRRIELYGRLNPSQQLWITGSRPMFHLNVYRSALVLRAHRWLISQRTQRRAGTTAASH